MVIFGYGARENIRRKNYHRTFFLKVCLLGGFTMSISKMNQMIRNLTLLLFIGLVFWSCEDPATIEIKNAINLLGNDAYYFLDVRTAEEHKIKSIPDTDCIPVQEIGKRIVELDKYRDKKIIVYCRSGSRSGTATKILNENGFKSYNMLGGMNEWNGEVVNQESELHLND